MNSAGDIHTFEKRERISFRYYNDLLETEDQTWLEQHCNATFRYSVQALNDVRNLSSKKLFKINCRVRLVFERPTHDMSDDKCLFTYPASVSLESSTKNSRDGAELICLVDYSPRTANSTVETSTSHNNGTQYSQTKQTTVGTANSTNTSIGAEAGFSQAFGFSGALTGNHGWGHDSSSSSLQGNQDDLSSSTNVSASMSIKNWGGYASANPTNHLISWNWFQEAPWHCIRDSWAGTNESDSSAVKVANDVYEKIFWKDEDGNLHAYPPSELSRFGLDFKMQSTWLIDEEINPKNLSFIHRIGFRWATHFAQQSQADDTGNASNSRNRDTTKTGVSRRIMPALITHECTDSFDLKLLALEALGSHEQGGGAIIGFGKFQSLSKKLAKDGVIPEGTRILSDRNNLLVTCFGFDESMNTTVQANHNQSSLTVQFKVTDLSAPLSLHMKGWMTKNNGSATLRIKAQHHSQNEYFDVTQITVNNIEGEGGQDNLMQLILRHDDYASANYVDYLKIGLNTLRIDISPTQNGSAFHMRAISLSI